MGKRINSCRKGKVAERKCAKFLNSLGFTGTHRGEQHKGGCESPDIVCPCLPKIHFEVKMSQRIDLGLDALGKAMEQSGRESAPGVVPVVIWKRNFTGWRLTYYDAHGRVTRDTDAGIKAALIELNTKGATP